MEVGRAFLLSSQKTMIWGILIYDMCRCRRDLDPLFYLKGALIKLFIWWHKTPSALKGRMLQIAPIFDNMCHVIVNIFLSVLSSIDFFVGLLNGIKSHDLVRHLLLDENSSSRRGLVIRLRERKNSRIPAVRSVRTNFSELNFFRTNYVTFKRMSLLRKTAYPQSAEAKNK